MVNLVFLDSHSPSPLALQALPTDDVGNLKAQIAREHPSSPKPDSIRLVRAGRFLRDNETVQDVLGGNLAEQADAQHTIHLVLRGAGTTAGVDQQSEVRGSSAGPSAVASSSTTPLLSQPTQTPSPAPPPTRSTLPAGTPVFPYDSVADLSDAVGLYTHLSRNALCELLGLPTVAWEDLVPSPHVSEHDAKILVRHTLSGFGVNSGFGSGVEGEDDGRGRLEDWVTEFGGEWTVDVDGLPYHLSVPSPSLLPVSQQTALHSYLVYSTRLTLLHAVIANPLPYILAMLPPLPTPTRAQALAAARRPSVWTRVVPMMAMNLIKYTLVWYIFTQEEGIWSKVAWAAALLGWWGWEGWQEYARAVGGGAAAVVPPPVRPRAEADAVAARAAAAAAATGTSTSATGEGSPAPPPPPPRPLPTFQLPPASSPVHSLALLGLAHESKVLALTPSTTSTSPSPSTPTPTPASDSAPTPPTPTLPPPRALHRTLLLAPLLLILSIAPPLEALRSSTIHKREAVMRETVEILSSSTSTSPSSSSAEGATQEPVLPRGLGSQAKAYYARVLDRGERIDWAAEEEAQRAAGAGGDGDGEGEGGGLFF